MPQFSSSFPQDGYGMRSVWYLKHFGSPIHIHDCTTVDAPRLGIMEFAPQTDDERQRPFWTYATNGMSERAMPNEREPRGRIHARLELIAYTQMQAPWVVSLLADLVRYPFVHRCGLYFGHTLPVELNARGLWSGYVIAVPPCEKAEFRPLGWDWGIAPDWVDFAQVVGLAGSELEFAERGGGAVLAKRVSEKAMPSNLFLDVQRALLFA
jgi:Suppressor of fused protein (SUFU)